MGEEVGDRQGERLDKKKNSHHHRFVLRPGGDAQKSITVIRFDGDEWSSLPGLFRTGGDGPFAMTISVVVLDPS